MKKRILSLFLLVLFLFPGITLAQETTEVEKNYINSKGDLIYEHIVSEKVKQADIEKQIKEFESKNKIGTRDDYYKYEYVYEPSEEKNIGGFLGNQAKNGMQFPTGGGFFYSWSGGPVISVSVNFPPPFNCITVSANIGEVGFSGKYISAPNNTDYFKLYGEKYIEVTPYTVWKVHPYTGERTVYYRNYTQTLDRERAWCVKVN